MNNKDLADNEWYLINCAGKAYVAGKYSDKFGGFWTYANGHPVLHHKGTKDTYSLLEKKEEKPVEPVKRRK